MILLLGQRENQEHKATICQLLSVGDLLHEYLLGHSREQTTEIFIKLARSILQVDHRFVNEFFNELKGQTRHLIIHVEIIQWL